MFRRIAILTTVLLSLPLAVSAQGNARPLERAMDLMRDGNWAAAQIEARGDGQAGLDVILWHSLREGLGKPREVQDFLSRNPDWPGLPYLKEKSESAMTAAPAEAIRMFYADHVPETGAGALSLARALLTADDRQAADEVVLRAWTTLTLTSDEQDAFVASYGDFLNPHHTARLDAMLWRGSASNARAMLPLVGEDWQALALSLIHI